MISVFSKILVATPSSTRFDFFVDVWNRRLLIVRSVSSDPVNTPVVQRFEKFVLVVVVPDLVL